MLHRGTHFGSRFPATGSAFTLVELLVVVAILGLLVAILVPTLQKGYELTRKVVCQMHIRDLQIGNQLYQADNNHFFAPGAAGIETGNLHRWFGSRLTSNPNTTPFDIDDGPLLSFLPGKAVRNCPSFTKFNSGFESGCGGYGYNTAYVGNYVVPDGAGSFANAYKYAHDQATYTGNLLDLFERPHQTVAFTDAAFVSGGLTEYSFCEPQRSPLTNSKNRPSIHFRHLGTASVVWLDTHVSEERMSFSNNVAGSVYPGKPVDFNVGFFGPETNELFDTK